MSRRKLQIGLIAAFTLIMLSLAGITVYAVTHARQASTPPPPLRLVGNVTLERQPSGDLGCNATIAFVASGSVTGEGVVSYEWERSDSTPSVKRQIPVSSGDTSFRTDPVYWTFSGSQRVAVTMTFHMLSPVEKKVSATLHETCT